MDSRKKFKYRGNACLNCSTSLDKSERYCHFCGQLNSTKKLTIKDFLEEFLSNFYAYDSRLRNSIVSIFTKPGVLAREFNEGKRQKYANPFRLFLSVSIALFITFSFDSSVQNNLTDDTSDKIEKNQIIEEKKHDSFVLDTLKSENDSLKNIVDTYKKQTKFSKDSIYTKDFIDKNINKNTEPLTFIITSYRNFHIKYPEKSEEQTLEELGYEKNLLNSIMYRKSIQFKSNNINEELLDYFYQKMPFILFLSLPIITLIFWLVYIRKNMNYTEHLVFSYTFFTFMFVCIIIFNLIDLISSNLSEILTSICFTFIIPFYFYKSLRNFYLQSRWKTILKFIILNPLFGIFLFISFILMTFLGIILF